MNFSISTELGKCAKCGTCRAVCPVFLELRDELMVTRGKLALFESAYSNPLSSLKKFRQALDCCLVCFKCLEKCPSLVKTTDLILAAREWLSTQKNGLPFPLKFAFRFIIPYRRLYNLAIKLLSIIRNSLFVIRNSQKDKIRHLPLIFASPLGRIPPITSKPILSQNTNYKLRTNGTTKYEVAIFTGCLVNYIYPQIYEATILVLKKEGISYITPTDQVCCGTPLLIYGDRRNASRLIQRNLKALTREKINTIITMCASCRRTLKEEYPKLEIPVWDIMEFIDRYIPHREGQTLNFRTTYHQPCHFIRTSVGEITRKILKKISFYQETDSDNLCCGGGGMFAFKYPEIAQRIGKHKIEFFLKSNIEIATSSCPGCLMQLNYLLRERDSQIQTCHPIELYARLL